MAFDTALYRKVLGQFATGVTLITTALDETPWAMTANAFTSISLNPPIVMVSVMEGETRTHILRTSAFAVNVLAADQIELAKRFGSRNRPPDQFADVRLRPGVTGAPILEGCLAWVDCRLVDHTEQGDHTVFFGQVEDMRIERQADPLLYYNSGYARIEPARKTRRARDHAVEGKLVFFDWELGEY